MFFAANGARVGPRATLPANTGYHIVTWIVTTAIGFGFAVAMMKLPGLFLAIKWIGSAYVRYIAWKLVRSRAMGEGGQAHPAGFCDGVFLLVLNPRPI